MYTRHTLNICIVVSVTKYRVPSLYRFSILRAKPNCIYHLLASFSVYLCNTILDSIWNKSVDWFIDWLNYVSVWKLNLLVYCITHTIRFSCINRVLRKYIQIFMTFPLLWSLSCKKVVSCNFCFSSHIINSQNDIWLCIDHLIVTRCDILRLLILLYVIVPM